MGFLIDIMELFGIYVMLTMSLNFLVGNLGVMYVGHIAFFALGSYCTAVLSTSLGWYPPLAMIIGIGLSIVISLILGMVTTRLASHYLLIASLGTCEIVRSIANNSKFTGGAEGILVPGSFLLPESVLAKFQVPILILVFLVLEIVFFNLLDKSPKGRLFNAVRDDSILLTMMGKSVNKLKVEALIISGIWASIAGSLFAHYSRYIDPTSFKVMDSLILLIAIMIGGIASYWGSVLAGVLLIIVPELIRFIQLPSSIISPMQQIIFASILLVILRVKPKGLTGKVLLK
jgi:branched-chain amino acid transport system permease protein